MSDKQSKTRSGQLTYILLYLYQWFDTAAEVVYTVDAKYSIQDIYLGIWVYADVIVLLAPTRNGLQEMTYICEKFAIQCKLKFSTNVNPSKSKTKCMTF